MDFRKTFSFYINDIKSRVVKIQNKFVRVILQIYINIFLFVYTEVTCK